LSEQTAVALDIRELDLADDRDFEALAVHIQELYTELFGAEAVPKPRDVERLRHQSWGPGSLAPLASTS
jgi:hypothetical protein